VFGGKHIVPRVLKRFAGSPPPGGKEIILKNSLLVDENVAHGWPERRRGLLDPLSNAAATNSHTLKI
jgi:hypothetical protein